MYALRTCALSLTLAACVVPDDDLELSEVEQGGWRDTCPGCAGNGEPPMAWNYAFSRLDFNGTKNHGAWDHGANGQVSICAPGSTNGSTCTLHPGWRSWVRAGNPNTEILTNVIKVVCAKGFTVRDTDPGGNDYPGAFGIAPHARANAWNHTDQELITAGTLGLLNVVDDVSVCLLADTLPNNCVGMKPQYGVFAESVALGNAYYGAGRYTAIVGQQYACEPEKNNRYGAIADAGSASQVFNCPNAPAGPYDPCSYTGSSETRRATSCTGGNGMVYHHPVTIIVPANPGTWYYNKPLGTPKPPSFPAPEQF